MTKKLTRREELAKLPVKPQRGRLTLWDIACELDINPDGLLKCDLVEYIARAEIARAEEKLSA